MIDYIYKIVVLGDSNAGKTTFVHYLNSSEQSSKGSTIGVDFNVYTKKICDDLTIKSQIWDTAGQEQFRAITKSYFRNVTGALIFFDVSDNNSISNTKQWLNDLIENDVHKDCIMFIANKCDLSYNMLSIPDTIETVKVLQCSSISRDNVEKTFLLFLNQLYHVQKTNKENIKTYDTFYHVKNVQITDQQNKHCCYS